MNKNLGLLQLLISAAKDDLQDGMKIFLLQGTKYSFLHSCVFSIMELYSAIQVYDLEGSLYSQKQHCQF